LKALPARAKAPAVDGAERVVTSRAVSQLTRVVRRCRLPKVVNAIAVADLQDKAREPLGPYSLCDVTVFGNHDRKRDVEG
jgi:hypothetical protein